MILQSDIWQYFKLIAKDVTENRFHNSQQSVALRALSTQATCYLANKIDDVHLKT